PAVPHRRAGVAGATLMPDTRVVEIVDERDPLADAALALITDMFAPEDRQPLAELRSEIAERRLGMMSGGYMHLLAAVEQDAADPAGRCDRRIPGPRQCRVHQLPRRAQ